jgi:hypothetical protein
MMKIVVPTRGRVRPLRILEQLRPIRRFVLVACPSSEQEKYKDWSVLPTDGDEKGGYCYAIQRIADTLAEPFLKVDDDVLLYVRTEPTRQVLATPQEVFRIYGWAKERLLDPATGAVSLMGRFGCNNLPMDEDVPYGSVRHVHGVKPALLASLGFSFTDSTLHCEDLDMSLTLLEAGYPVWTSCRWLGEEVATKENRLVGGCHTEGTQAGAAERSTGILRAFEELARRHPGHVRIHDQTSKKMLEHGFVKKVVCSWKRAYLAGQRRRRAAEIEAKYSLIRGG